MKPRNAPALRSRAAAPRTGAARVAWAGCVLAASAAMAGCAHPPCPPFRAAWYLDKPQESAPVVYLALLNEGVSPLPLERVVLNPAEPDGSGSVVFASAALRPDALPPGRLLLLALDDKLGRCYLPVAVQLQCGQGRASTQPVSGLLPNYLHEQWIVSCGEGALDRYPPGAAAVQR